MMQSDAINWSAAIVLSLLVHSVVFMGSGAQPGAENVMALQAPLVTRLSFNQPVESLPLDEPQPVKKPQPRPVKKIEPKVVKARTAKTRTAKTRPAKKQPEKKQLSQRTAPVEEAEPVSQPAALPHVQGQQVGHSSDALLQRERQQYLHKLLSHIESFKYYPRAARRRSIEGDVKISFILSDDGHFEQLVLDGGHTVLVKAARQSLESATPLPAPPKEIKLSRQIEFVMVYSLTR